MMNGKAVTAQGGPSVDPIQMRAAASADLVAGIGRGLSLLADLVLARILRWHRERTTRDALLALSDHVLRDIGIARADIPTLARGLDPAQGRPPESALGRWLEARSERRQALRELMAYSDRELDQLGVRRRDIPALLRAPALPHAA
jgi:uncharacterized protein YjiS (DUF1127 family)